MPVAEDIGAVEEQDRHQDFGYIHQDLIRDFRVQLVAKSLCGAVLFGLVLPIVGQKHDHRRRAKEQHTALAVGIESAVYKDDICHKVRRAHFIHALFDIAFCGFVHRYV